MKFRPKEDFSDFYGNRPARKQKLWEPHKERKYNIRRRNPPQWVKDFVHQRDNYTCKKCKWKSKRKSTIDHRIPWSISKDSSIENLITLCKDCNEKKSDRLMLKNGSYVLATPENIERYKDKLF